MRDLSVVSAPASFGFAKTRACKKTPAALLDHDEPHREEASMWLHISVWLLMGAHRPGKASGLWISWLQTFSSKWLIRGGYAERTGETAVGVWLSGETLVGDNLSAPLPRLRYKTQPCLDSLCNVKKTFLLVIISCSPVRPQCWVPNIINLPYSFFCVTHEKPQGRSYKAVFIIIIIMNAATFQRTF